jgi:hypothetical protein
VRTGEVVYGNTGLRRRETMLQQTRAGIDVGKGHLYAVVMDGDPPLWN